MLSLNYEICLYSHSFGGHPEGKPSNKYTSKNTPMTEDVAREAFHDMCHYSFKHEKWQIYYNDVVKLLLA